MSRIIEDMEAKKNPGSIRKYAKTELKKGIMCGIVWKKGLKEVTIYSLC